MREGGGEDGSDGDGDDDDDDEGGDATAVMVERSDVSDPAWGGIRRRRRSRRRDDRQRRRRRQYRRPGVGRKGWNERVLRTPPSLAIVEDNPSDARLHVLRQASARRRTDHGAQIGPDRT